MSDSARHLLQAVKSPEPPRKRRCILDSDDEDNTCSLAPKGADSDSSREGSGYDTSDEEDVNYGHNLVMQQQLDLPKRHDDPTDYRAGMSRSQLLSKTLPRKADRKSTRLNSSH